MRKGRAFRRDPLQRGKPDYKAQNEVLQRAPLLEQGADHDFLRKQIAARVVGFVPGTEVNLCDGNDRPRAWHKNELAVEGAILETQSPDVIAHRGFC